MSTYISFYVSEILQIVDKGEFPANHSAYSNLECWGVGVMGGW